MFTQYPFRAHKIHIPCFLKKSTHVLCSLVQQEHEYIDVFRKPVPKVSSSLHIGCILYIQMREQRESALSVSIDKSTLYQSSTCTQAVTNPLKERDMMAMCKTKLPVKFMGSLKNRLTASMGGGRPQCPGQC